MQAIELEAQINELHEIHLKLPDDVNATSAKVIIMYENTPKNKKRVFGQFQGKIKIDDSFDDELSNDFWLGDSK